MKISVSSSVGVATPQSLDVDPLETVAQLREKVAGVQAVDPNSISLVHNGTVLPLEKTLKNVGMKDGDALKAMPANPVGGLAASPFFPSDFLRNRLANEAARVYAAGIELRPLTPFEWVGSVRGAGTWHSRSFRFRVLIPESYPASPPLVQFLTIFEPQHPNVSPTGHVCLNHLMGDWSPTMNLVSVYEELVWLIENPNYLHGFFGGRRTRERSPRVANYLDLWRLGRA